MRVLLDTHALIWALGEPDRLSPRARATIADQATVVFVSLTSAWELAILQSLDRVRLKVPLGLTERLRVVSADRAFARYGVPVVW